jgi:hypothetical protein
MHPLQSIFSFNLDALGTEFSINAEEAPEILSIPEPLPTEEEEEEEIKSLYPACSVCPDETYPTSS